MCRSIPLALLPAVVAAAMLAPAVARASAGTAPAHAVAASDSGTGPHAMPPGHVAAPAPKPETGAGWKLPPGKPAPIARSETGPALKPGEKLRMKTVTLHVFHRVFRNFHDQVEARLKQEFRIGDSEYTGVVTEFVPDFALDLKSHKVTSRSQEPNNPAWHIVVRKNGTPVDTTWAFLDVQPHFTRRALVGFVATRVTFENHGTVTSRDSLAIRLMQSEGK